MLNRDLFGYQGSLRPSNGALSKVASPRSAPTGFAPNSATTGLSAGNAYNRWRDGPHRERTQLHGSRAAEERDQKTQRRIKLCYQFHTHPRDRIVGACLKSGVARTQVAGYWITFHHRGRAPLYPWDPKVCGVLPACLSVPACAVLLDSPRADSILKTHGLS